MSPRIPTRRLTSTDDIFGTYTVLGISTP
jgi:hypothetical protein